MSRDLEPWEICEANQFSGIHLWLLGSYETPDKVKHRQAYCKVCGFRPENYQRETVIIATLERQLEAQREAERVRKLFRSVGGKRRL